MKKSYLLSCLLLVIVQAAWSQSGNYRTSGLSTTWSDPAAWQVDPGSGFIAASQSPTSSSGTILIQAGHTVDITDALTIDQVTVNGTLNINGDVTVTLANGTGDDLVNNGTVNILIDLESGVLNVNAGAVLRNNTGSTLVSPGVSSISFNGNSTYHHNLNGGSIPNATWSTTSICYVTGVVGTNPTNFNQNFGNLVWECNGQTGARLLGLSGNRNFAESIDIRNTGSGSLFFTTSSNVTITTPNLLVSGNARFALTSAGNPVTLNVTNYTNSSTNTTASSLASTGSGILNVTGSFTISGANGLTGTAGSELRFTGSSSQTYSSSVAFTGLNIRVNSGVTLDLNAGLLSTTGDFEMQANATVQLGSQSGNGAFSPTGNIDADSYTIAGGANFQYDGGTQTLGTDFTFSDVNVIVSGNTTLSQNAPLTISTGRSLTINSGSTFSIGSQTLTINGTIGGTGTLSGGSTANLVIGGTGSFGSLVVSNDLNNLTINRSSSGSVVLGSNLSIGGTFTHAEGDFDISNRTLTLNGVYSATESSSITTNNSSTLIIQGSGALSEIQFAGTTLNTLTLNRSGSSLSTDAALTITNLNLTSGTLSNTAALTIAAGGTITRSPIAGTGGSMAVSPGAVSSYNVIYNGSGTTGPELPTSATAINNVTKQGSGTLTLNNNLTVNGTLAFNSGTFNGNGRSITIVGGLSSIGSSSLTTSTVTFAGNPSTLTGSTAPVFGALTIAASASLTPSVSYGVNGALTNNGTLNAGSGITVTFGGTTTITGNVCSFNNVIISGTLNAPANMNVSGNWQNDGNFVRGVNGNTLTFNGVTSFTGTNTTSFSSIANSGTLNAPATLNIAGNLTNSGTFVAGTGTVVFNGTAGQSIAGTSSIVFNNVTMNKSPGSTLTFSSAHSLSNVLTLSGGTLNPNGNLTLLSSASGDARIAQVTGGATISATNMIVQRYMPNAAVNRTFRYIAPPVSGAFVSGIKDDTPVTGTFSDPSTQAEWPGIPNIVQASPSMYRYHEPLSAPSSVNDKWQTYPLTGTASTAASLEHGRGYSVFVRQTAPITIDLTGVATVGPVNVNVTAQSAGGNDGFNLIGNPFVSPISWSAVALPAGVSSQIALKDNSNNIDNGTGSYIYYTPGGAAIPADYDGTIASGQAFWVRTTQNATIVFQEDDKLAVSNPTFIRKKAIDNLVRIKIAGNSRKDELVVVFDTNATDNEDPNYDALKFQNDFINFSSLSLDGKKLAINYMGGLGCNKEVSLNLENVTAGAYALSFDEFTSFEPNVALKLVDNFSGATFTISEANSMYDFSVTSDPRTFDAGRFKLLVTYPEVSTSITADDMTVCQGSDGKITLKNTQQGVSYMAKINGETVSDSGLGNGSDLTLSIPSDKLASPLNTVVVYGSLAQCAAVPMADNISIKREAIAEISSVTGASICKSGSLTLTANGAPTNGSYKWYTSESELANIDGATLGSFTTPVLDRTRTYYVSAVNSLGCEGPRKPVVATVTGYEDVVVEVDGLKITSSYETGNQWFKDGVVIPGATGQTIEVTESGLYEVEIKLSGGCSTRAGSEMIVLGLDSEFADDYTVYPNPVSGALHVEVNGSTPVEGSLRNSLGQNVTAINFKASGNKWVAFLSLEGMPQGFYLVNLKQGNKVINHKILKK